MIKTTGCGILNKKLERSRRVFLEERYKRILSKLEGEGRVTVKNLAKEFDVTEDCIRKDLRELENRNQLKRVYGGAILKGSHVPIPSVEERHSMNLELKQKIADRAMALIEEGDSIFFDSSTINIEIAERLAKSGCTATVVTNMLEIAILFKMHPRIKLICIGGEFDNNVGAVVGSVADGYIRMFAYDIAFIGVCGVNLEEGSMSTDNLIDGTTKKTIIECSTRNYLVMEKEKFNYKRFYKFAKLTEITGIITEDEVMLEL